MANRKKGIRIGNYRITPLGIGTIIALIVIIAAVIVILVMKPFDLNQSPDNSTTNANISATPDVSVTAAPTAAATPVPTATPTPAPELRSATIRSLGEIAIQQNLLAAAYDSETKTYDFTDMFEYISDVMGDADYTVGDVEGSLGGTMDATGEGSRLVTPPSLIDALKACGVDMLTLANDHALDGMFGDLTAAMQNLKNAGMEYIGAAMSQEEKDTPKIVEINGIKVGFLAYTESLNGMEAKSDADAVKYGVNLISGSTTPDADTKALRDAGADVVICYMSWGEMLNRSATNNQKIFAKALVDAGVDVIIGYNPHAVQPALWLESSGNRTLCLCATGNFLSDIRDRYFDSGLIFQFTIQEKADYSGFEITNPLYIPTYVWRIENEDGTFDYRTLAAGQWLETKPEGMDYTQETRMKQVYAEQQSIMGKDVAAISAE